MFRCLAFALLSAALALPASAGLKKINYGQRSSIQDEKADDFEVKQPEMNTQFDGQRMDLSQWHTQFSTLGQKKSEMLSGADRFSGEKQEFAMQEMKMKNTSMAPGNRKMTQPRNWNYAMDNLMAGKFQGAEITSPVGRQMQQYIDEVNLRDMNRYVFQSNMTEDGIPVQRTGEGALSEIPMQLRDNGRPVFDPDDENGDPSVLFRSPFQRNGSDDEASDVDTAPSSSYNRDNGYTTTTRVLPESHNSDK
ncbi:MAG: hypothetical protein Q7Q73_19485 [Verrucomicrobiota bacterium JB024]|nr:hypothetical protein [Verrucomicrobiota bacterium JB024]